MIFSKCTQQTCSLLFYVVQWKHSLVIVHVCMLVFVLLLLWEDTCSSWGRWHGSISRSPVLFSDVDGTNILFSVTWSFFKCWAWTFYTDHGNSSLTKWSWELSITTKQTPYTAVDGPWVKCLFFSLAFGDHLNSWMCYSQTHTRGLGIVFFLVNGCYFVFMITPRHCSQT